MWNPFAAFTSVSEVEHHIAVVISCIEDWNRADISDCDAALESSVKEELLAAKTFLAHQTASAINDRYRNNGEDAAKALKKQLDDAFEATAKQVLQEFQQHKERKCEGHKKLHRKPFFVENHSLSYTVVSERGTLDCQISLEVVGEQLHIRAAKGCHRSNTVLAIPVKEAYVLAALQLYDPHEQSRKHTVTVHAKNFEFFLKMNARPMDQIRDLIQQHQNDPTELAKAFIRKFAIETADVGKSSSGSAILKLGRKRNKHSLATVEGGCWALSAAMEAYCVSRDAAAQGKNGLCHEWTDSRKVAQGGVRRAAELAGMTVQLEEGKGASGFVCGTRLFEALSCEQMYERVEKCEPHRHVVVKTVLSDGHYSTARAINHRKKPDGTLTCSYQILDPERASSTGLPRVVDKFEGGKQIFIVRRVPPSPTGAPAPQAAAQADADIGTGRKVKPGVVSGKKCSKCGKTDADHPAPGRGGGAVTCAGCGAYLLNGCAPDVKDFELYTRRDTPYCCCKKCEATSKRGQERRGPARPSSTAATESAPAAAGAADAVPTSPQHQQQQQQRAGGKGPTAAPKAAPKPAPAKTPSKDKPEIANGVKRTAGRHAKGPNFVRGAQPNSSSTPPECVKTVVEPGPHVIGDGSFDALAERVGFRPGRARSPIDPAQFRGSMMAYVTVISSRQLQGSVYPHLYAESRSFAVPTVEPVVWQSLEFSTRDLSRTVGEKFVRYCREHEERLGGYSLPAAAAQFLVSAFSTDASGTSGQKTPATVHRYGTALQSFMRDLPLYSLGSGFPSLRLEASADRSFKNCLASLGTLTAMETATNLPAVTLEQLHAAFATIPEDRHRSIGAMMVLQLCLSQRGDVANLRGENIAAWDPQTGALSILVTRSKGVKIQRQPYTVSTTIPDRYRQLIDQVISDSKKAPPSESIYQGLVFRKGVTDIERARHNALFRGVNRALKTINPRLTTRAIRRGAIQMLEASGAPLQVVMEMAGHRNPVTTNKYLGHGTNRTQQIAGQLQATGAAFSQ